MAYGLTYDALGQVTAIVDHAGGRLVEFAYDAVGSCVTLTRYSDILGIQMVATTTYGYDNAGRLASLLHEAGLAQLAYGLTYDAAGRLVGLVTPDGSSDLDYDATGQVTSASLTGEEYEYDVIGNRTSGGSVAGGDNRLLEDATYVYTYDLEGNLIGKARKDGAESTTYEWDYRNRLTSVTVQNVSGQVTLAAVYTYDAFDRRIGRVVSGTINLSERYVYDNASNAQAVLVLDNNGTPLTRILYGIVENQVLVEEELPTGYIRWALCDHLQSVRDVLNNSGTVVNHIVYDSFGNILSQSNTINTTRNLYTGAPLDAETGWTYLHRRYYDASLGRFMSQDPLSFSAGDTNLYRYVGNNPLTYRDPSGLQRVGGDDLTAKQNDIVSRLNNREFVSADEMAAAGIPRSSIERFLENQIKRSTAKFTVPSQLERSWDVATGYFYDAPIAAFKGVHYMFTHPVEMYEALKCPAKTLDAMGAAIVEAWNSGDRGKGQVFGDVVQGFASGRVIKPARGGKYTMPASNQAADYTVVRYVGAGEAKVAQSSGFIPAVDKLGNPKTVFVTPDAPLRSATQAEIVYQIGSKNPIGPSPTPTHVITGNAKGITFDYGGNVAGGSGIELTTTTKIPVTSVKPIK